MTSLRRHPRTPAFTGIVPNRFVVGLLLLLATVVIDAGQPLKPHDTSSPRATMESYLALTDEGARRMVDHVISIKSINIDFLQQQPFQPRLSERLHLGEQPVEQQLP